MIGILILFFIGLIFILAIPKWLIIIAWAFLCGYIYATKMNDDQ